MIAKAIDFGEKWLFPLEDAGNICILVYKKSEMKKHGTGHGGGMSMPAIKRIRKGNSEYDKKLLNALLEEGNKIDEQNGFWMYTMDGEVLIDVPISCSSTIQALLNL